MILIYNICKDQGKDEAQGLEKSPGFLKKTFMFLLSRCPAQSPVPDSNPRNWALAPASNANVPAAGGRHAAPENRKEKTQLSARPRQHKYYVALELHDLLQQVLEPGAAAAPREEREGKGFAACRAFPASQPPLPARPPCPGVYCKEGISWSRATIPGNLGPQPAEGTSEMRLERAGSGGESFLVKLL